MTQVDGGFWSGTSEIGASYLEGDTGTFLYTDIMAAFPDRLTDDFLSYDKNGTVTFESSAWNNADTVVYPGTNAKEIYDY